jgi:hypothetical protein
LIQVITMQAEARVLPLCPRFATAVFGRVVFRCSTVGAVHLEMLDSMDTSSFLMAVERFLAVRPRLTVFLADNGSNFKGGLSTLKGRDQIDVSEAQGKFNFEFRFAPPRAPHFMGLVERIVGAAKAALRPALGTRIVSAEELRMVIAKTMGIINNFPIAYMTRSDSDFHYKLLSANHFCWVNPTQSYKQLTRRPFRRQNDTKNYRRSSRYFGPN